MRYGIKTKTNNIIALILGIIGVIVLILKVTKVLADDFYTLVSLIFFLLGFAFFLRPKSKIVKKESDLILKYREEIYKEMVKDCKRDINVKNITFKEDEDGKFSFNDIYFNELSRSDFFRLITKIIDEFIDIFYKVDTSKMTKEEKKQNKNKTVIDSFEIIVIFKDGKEYREKKIDNYQIIK